MTVHQLRSLADTIVCAMTPFVEPNGDIPTPDTALEIEEMDRRAWEAMLAAGAPTKLSDLAELYVELERIARADMAPKSGAAGVAMNAIDKHAMCELPAVDAADIQARVWWLGQDATWELCIAQERIPGLLCADVERVCGRQDEGGLSHV